jgi:hypothetical protein
VTRSPANATFCETSTGASGATVGTAEADLDGRLIFDVESTRVKARTRNCKAEPISSPLEIVTVAEVDAVFEIRVDQEVPLVDFSTRYPVKVPPFKLFGATQVSFTRGDLGFCGLKAFFAVNEVGAEAGIAVSLIAGGTKVARSPSEE